MVDLKQPELPSALSEADLALVLALDRYGGDEYFLGLLQGSGLRRGACATSMTWDTTDCIAVGNDVVSLETAVRRLEERGGGAVFALEREVLAEFPAPYYGIFSSQPLETVAGQLEGVERALKGNGMRWERPLLTLNTLTTAAIPHLRITRRGYVRLKEGALLPLKP
jgi:adenine deaminase